MFSFRQNVMLNNFLFYLQAKHIMKKQLSETVQELLKEGRAKKGREYKGFSA